MGDNITEQDLLNIQDIMVIVLTIYQSMERFESYNHKATAEILSPSL